MVQIRPVKIFELDFHLFHILVTTMWKRWKSSSKIFTGVIWTVLYLIHELLNSSGLITVHKMAAFVKADGTLKAETLNAAI